MTAQAAVRGREGWNFPPKKGTGDVPGLGRLLEWASMDEKRASYSLRAPGSPGKSVAVRLPGRGFPALDDHLVEPEVTRDEVISGRRVVALPADSPHADKHVDLAYVLRAHVAPGYRASADLITRHTVDSDFATDACVYREGIDPETGGRYLEEIAFEVISTQNEKNATEKAVVMHRRGVRRIFGIWVKGRRRTCEWSPESQSWRLLDAGSRIEDPCLVAPLPVAALLDAAMVHRAVVEALVAQGNPEIREREVAAEARGRAEGMAEGVASAILEVLAARGIAVSETQRQEISSCHDQDRLRRWLHRAALAASAKEVLSNL